MNYLHKGIMKINIYNRLSKSHHEKSCLDSIALRTAKTPQSFGHSACNRVKVWSFAHSECNRVKVCSFAHSECNRDKVNGYTSMFYYHFTMGNNFCGFLLAFLDYTALPK